MEPPLRARFFVRIVRTGKFPGIYEIAPRSYPIYYNMDYLDHFRPIFSVAAHARYALGEPDAGSVAPECLASLEELLDHARSVRRRAGAAGFDAAWFALCAWLHEILPGCRPLVEPHFDAADCGRKFFRRLDALLTRKGPGPMDPESAAALRVYAACLDLGFRGPHWGPGSEGLLERYRIACRKRLPARQCPAEAIPAALPERRERVRFPEPVPVLLWFLPAATMAILFTLCRHLLADLYMTAFG